MKRELFLVSVAFLLAFNLSNERLFAQWQSCNACSQSCVRSLLVLNDTIFAGAYGDGIYTSSDMAASWSRVGVGIVDDRVNCLASDGKRHFAGTEKGVFVSDDGGTNWHKAEFGLSDEKVRSMLVCGAVALVGTDSGRVYHSADSGKTWVSGNSGLPGNSVLSLTSFGSTIFAGTCGEGVFQSVDSGVSWTHFGSGTICPEVCALVVCDSFLISGTFAGVFRARIDDPKWIAIPAALTHTQIVSLVGVGENVFVGARGGGIFVYNARDYTFNNVTAEIENPYISTVAAGTENIFAAAECVRGWDIYVSGASEIEDLSGKGNNVLSHRGELRPGPGDLAGGIWKRKISDMITRVVPRPGPIPSDFSLAQNFPNPFNPSTFLRFTLGRESTVSLVVFNLLGQRVMERDLGVMNAGTHEIRLDMTGFAGGVYYCMLESATPDFQPVFLTNKMVLIK